MCLSYGRFSDSPFFGLFLPFTLTFTCPLLDRLVHNPLPQKDAPTPTRHRVQFIACKTSIRWSYGRFSDSPFFGLFLPFTLTFTCPLPPPSLNNPLPQKDAPGHPPLRVQFIASKTSIRSYGRSSDSPFFKSFSRFNGMAKTAKIHY